MLTHMRKKGIKTQKITWPEVSWLRTPLPKKEGTSSGVVAFRFRGKKWLCFRCTEPYCRMPDCSIEKIRPAHRERERAELGTTAPGGRKKWEESSPVSGIFLAQWELYVYIPSSPIQKYGSVQRINASTVIRSTRTSPGAWGPNPGGCASIHRIMTIYFFSFELNRLVPSNN